MNATARAIPGKRRYRMAVRAETVAATGERILAAAWEHFASRPYEDVRLRDIAADANVTAQTLHNRFHSKEQLFTAAVLWYGAQEVTERDTAPIGDVPGAVKVLFDRYEAHGEAILRLLSHEDRIPAVRRMTNAGRAYHRRWAKRTFAPLLHGHRGAARRRRLIAIITATDLLVWKLLRLDMQLTRVDAEAIIAVMVDGVPAMQPLVSAKPGSDQP